MERCFRGAQLLLPDRVEMEKWAVIACDQFTSDPAYWQRVRRTVDSAPSTLNMILPEAELTADNRAAIEKINATMEQYLQEGIFKAYENAYVYVERTLQNGTIRQGIVGTVDLEKYDHRPEAMAQIRATEKTVLERVPPRMEVRMQASVEFSHVLMLCDDRTCTLIEPVAAKKDTLPKLYDFDLMEGGGHITGWLLSGEAARTFEQAVDDYEQDHVYLVGDGNHSLVAAKGCYEKHKTDGNTALSRYATVELENVHAPSMVFEPIYRILTETDPQALIAYLEKNGGQAGTPITYRTGELQGVVYIDLQEGELPIGGLQRLLDSWLSENAGHMDYIHDEDAVLQMAGKENAIGFLLPAMDKAMLFPFITAGNLLSRKAFSMGHGCEKRYYLEGRRIR